MAKQKNIGYKIILILDGRQKKIVLKSNDRDFIIKEYNRLVSKNNQKVVIPKKFNNNNSIKECQYELLLLKDLGPDALTEPSKIFNGCKIILREEFLIEETFAMYGFDSRKERKTIHDIVKIITKQKSNLPKEIIIVHNKLLIYNDDYFDMVICKCEDDAKRLNSVLFHLFQKSDELKFIFMGIAKLENMTYFYNLIQEETQWSRGRIRRTTTRP